MRKVSTPIVCLAGMLALGVVSAPAERTQDEREAIVKIYTKQNTADYYNPWNMRGLRQGTGSGCIIAGQKILTNAHVISDPTFIQVRRHGEARRYEAKVLSVSHEADLALLSVDDPAFFEGIEPLEFGELPETQDEVLVYGFPLGGDTLSTTKGVVSRIEHQRYSHSASYFLAGQIDAAINPGNSGGPVLKDGRVVGVVMQTMKRADNIGYMVPVTIVRHVLEDIEDGHYDGFSSLGVLLQKMENPDLKRMYKVPQDETGVLVARIFPGSPGEDVLERGDVLLSVDGHEVADDSTVEYRPKERTSVSYYIQQHQIGDECRLEILRDGEQREVTIPLDRPHQEDLLIPMDAYDVLPSYYIYGGLVFCPLTKNFLKAWGSNWPSSAPKELVARLGLNYPEYEDQEIVLLLKVLAADVNQGYDSVGNRVITSVDGEKIKNLKDLVNKVERGTDNLFVVFEDEVGRQVVLDREKAAQSHEQILRTYRISENRSDDLRDL